MINCYIVDDEKAGTDILSMYIEQTPGLKLIKAEENAVLAYEDISNDIYKPQVTFLDIRIPLLSGMELAGLISHKTAVIFTTAYGEYAADAFGKDAIDYLVKPFSYERFLKSIDKLKKKLITDGDQSRIEQKGFFYVQNEIKGRITKIVISDIIYVESLLNYINIVTIEGEHKTYMSLKEMEVHLAEGNFMRIHKSFIINMFKIVSVENDQVLLKTHKKLSIGTNYKNDFFAVLNDAIIKSKRR
ncbi:response regulator transcription factor [Mucilaginibacter sp. HC2]|uniref:LytR/AlgR family response regulator transcription factor n=1 Tax=Mucilaginibacter inviolabilis TaxID=2714892 RepID=UPI0014096BBA|nr:LytTR family DNA-binding domain-containing protein [Mucilaginibacter inviolabilis]NHA05819.1 response regulator transcription factor [Mucilaginibacter inviolabilis]